MFTFLQHNNFTLLTGFGAGVSQAVKTPHPGNAARASGTLPGAFQNFLTSAALRLFAAGDSLPTLPKNQLAISPGFLNFIGRQAAPNGLPTDAVAGLPGTASARPAISPVNRIPASAGEENPPLLAISENGRTTLYRLVNILPIAGDAGTTAAATTEPAAADATSRPGRLQKTDVAVGEPPAGPVPLIFGQAPAPDGPDARPAGTPMSPPGNFQFILMAVPQTADQAAQPRPANTMAPPVLQLDVQMGNRPLLRMTFQAIPSDPATATPPFLAALPTDAGSGMESAPVNPEGGNFTPQKGQAVPLAGTTAMPQTSIPISANSMSGGITPAPNEGEPAHFTRAPVPSGTPVKGAALVSGQPQAATGHQPATVSPLFTGLGDTAAHPSEPLQSMPRIQPNKKQPVSNGSPALSTPISGSPAKAPGILRTAPAGAIFADQAPASERTPQVQNAAGRNGQQPAADSAPEPRTATPAVSGSNSPFFSFPEIPHSVRPAFTGEATASPQTTSARSASQPAQPSEAPFQPIRIVSEVPVTDSPQPVPRQSRQAAPAKTEAAGRPLTILLTTAPEFQNSVVLAAPVEESAVTGKTASAGRPIIASGIAALSEPRQPAIPLANDGPAAPKPAKTGAGASPRPRFVRIMPSLNITRDTPAESPVPQAPKHLNTIPQPGYSLKGWQNNHSLQGNLMEILAESAPAAVAGKSLPGMAEHTQAVQTPLMPETARAGRQSVPTDSATPQMTDTAGDGQRTEDPGQQAAGHQLHGKTSAGKTGQSHPVTGGPTAESGTFSESLTNASRHPAGKTAEDGGPAGMTGEKESGINPPGKAARPTAPPTGNTPAITERHPVTGNKDKSETFKLPEKETMHIDQNFHPVSGKGIKTAAHSAIPKAPIPANLNQPAQIVEHIARYFQLSVNNRQQQMLLELRPESLGLIKIQLKMQDDRMVGRVEVSSPEVHQILMRHLPELTHKLQAMNIRLEQMDVSVMPDAANGSHQQNQAGNPGFGRGRNYGGATGDVPREPAAEVQNRLKFQYSTFEYIA